MRHSLILVLLLLGATTFISCTNTADSDLNFTDNPASQNSELPFLYSDNAGNIFLSWVEPGDANGEYQLLYSRLNNNQWSEPEVISQSTSWFVNWADYPSIVAHSGEAMAAHTLKKIPGNAYSYNVNVSLKNGPNDWSRPFAPHNDSTATEHGFVSMVPLSKENIMIAWLDGRRTTNRADEEYFDLSKAMTIRSAIVDTSGSVKERNLIDDSVCDCCQTSMVLTDKGPFVAYRNRTDDEIRDIYYSRYENNSWSEPAPIHNDGWKIGACPVNGPKAIAKDSLVAVSWYTRASGTPTVKAAISTDYGKSFGEPIVINDQGTSGRVDVVISDSETVYVSDINKTGDTFYLTAYKLNYSEGTLESHRVAEMNGSRRSGFPQMEAANGELIFAWTDVKDDTLTKVQTAILKF